MTAASNGPAVRTPRVQTRTDQLRDTEGRAAHEPLRVLGSKSCLAGMAHRHGGDEGMNLFCHDDRLSFFSRPFVSPRIRPSPALGAPSSLRSITPIVTGAGFGWLRSEIRTSTTQRISSPSLFVDSNGLIARNRRSPGCPRFWPLPWPLPASRRWSITCDAFCNPEGRSGSQVGVRTAFRACGSSSDLTLGGDADDPCG